MAINEKLRVYKQPIVVALDLVEVLGEYQAVRDAFYGAQPIVVPIDMMGRGSAGVARLGAMQNGMLVGRDRNAQSERKDEDTVMMRWEPAANPKDWSHRP